MYRRLKRKITNRFLKDLYGIKCKEIEEVYLASKKVISSPESVYNNKRVLWNETTNVYDVKDIREQKGINSIGFFKENIGLSHSARYFTRILQHEKIPFTVNHFELKKDGHTNHEFDRYLDDSLKYNVNVFNFNSNYCMEYYKRFPERFNKHYNIGYGYWEFEKYPLSFLNQNNVFDEMWVSTDFILKSFCQYYVIPVVKIPIAIDFDVNNLSKYNRKYFGLPEKAFAFIFTFDVGSEIGGRKNSLGVIEAFKNAFASDDESVCLIIKTAPRTSEENNPKHKEILDKLYKEAEQKNIIVYNKTLTDDEMKGLINSCQVYVSLHRCEGLGLGMIEAMKMGKPVIATGYSGNTEFMKHDNSCLVDYKLIPSTLFSTLVSGHVWADPDVEQASFYMKRLYENADYYKQISIKAKQYVDDNHNYRVAGEVIRHRLKLLGLLD